MEQFIIAVEDENIQSPFEVYDGEDTIGDVCHLHGNINIHAFFDERFRNLTGSNIMKSDDIILVTEDDLEALMLAFPTDDEIHDVSMRIKNTLMAYPSAGFFYSFER